MRFEFCASMASVAMAACVLAMGGMSAARADHRATVHVTPAFAADYHGYRLRPPYYIHGRWHYPAVYHGPTHYYSHHPYHAPGYPVPIYRTDRPAVVVRETIRVAAPVAAHVAWCAERYRSYRVSDDSFQPHHGPRRRCVSPYR